MSFHRLFIALALAAATTLPAAASVPPSTGPLAGPSPAASTAPPAAENPAITSAARTQFLAWQAGKIDRGLYNAEANKQLTDAIVSDIATKMGPLGAPTKFSFLDKSTVDNNTLYTYGVDTPKARLQMLYALDNDGKISGIFFRPAP